MKKALLATTLLVATAGFAAAEVSFSGYGRFGLEYDDSRAVNETRISARLRFNINAKLETDSGLTFGGRIRLQHTTGATGAALSPALLYVEYNGLRVEVGNSNAAYDSAGLLYAAEMGYLDRSFGDSNGFNYYGFNSGPYGAAEANRVGIFASYSVGDFTGRISFINPDQTAAAATEEISISVDYASGPFSISLAAAQDGAGIANNDLFFIGAAYAIGDNANVGINYMDETVIGADGGATVLIYGNYTLASGVTLRAYVSDNDNPLTTDTAFGIGADYSLGEGARLSGSIQKGYAGQTIADVGVRFDF